ncbi:MAG: fumarate hydratase C-terminal domain-containing protein [Candidatus Omnitrophica bacterium]|nr:fumarate hydratase C-terminal domain-containing protein [Candidatus Omnitrophota bacterium]
MKHISTPLDDNIISSLRIGDEVLLSGTILTARDQAHLRICELLKKHGTLPVKLNGRVIYYCGPTLATKGEVIGSCGPTTSRRMDEFTPAILKAGVNGLIGKGGRSVEVIEAIKKYKAVYFAAPAGCGSYLNTKVISSNIVAFPDLGPEAVYELEVRDFPLIVAVDARGKSLY